jgi:hypothetical protein
VDDDAGLHVMRVQPGIYCHAFDAAARTLHREEELRTRLVRPFASTSPGGGGCHEPYTAHWLGTAGGGLRTSQIPDKAGPPVTSAELVYERAPCDLFCILGG